MIHGDKVKKWHLNNKQKPIDKVTTDSLDVALRCVDIRVNIHILDKIIDVIELLEEKGNNTTIDDLTNLKMQWKK